MTKRTTAALGHTTTYTSDSNENVVAVFETIEEQPSHGCGVVQREVLACCPRLRAGAFIPNSLIVGLGKPFLHRG
jgi:hypothetical protein